MDMYCVDDASLWINLEIFFLKKADTFNTQTLIKVMNHFAKQQEGSGDFYEYFEHCFMSDNFEKLSLSDYITLGYNFYLVHAGSSDFFKIYYIKLIDRMDEKISTFDLLRVMQMFAELAQHFPNIFSKTEFLLLKRFEQLTLDQITCAACAFAISGYGSDRIFRMFETMVMKNFTNLD